MFEISCGIISKAQKVCIYGVEGVGKSTFAARFPSPLFIDTEGSTGNMDVKRLPKPTSWQMLISELDFVIKEKPCKSLVIDTVDWAENLCIDAILQKHGKNGIEDFGYGNGYVYEKEEFARFLNKTEDIITAGINVILTAHAQLRKFTQPDEIGEYDRYELKLGKKTGSQISPLIKEWADILLFANYKTMAVAVDKEGKKFKAQGNARVMYTEHHPCWDAKNRFGLPAELPFDYSKIAHIFNASDTVSAVPEPISKNEPTAESIVKTTYWFDGIKTYITEGEKPQSEREVFEISYEEFVKLNEAAEKLKKAENTPETTADEYEGIPKALADLMQINGVSEREIRHIVFKNKFFPEDMPVKAYPKEFTEGMLIAQWNKVFDLIKRIRLDESLPK